MPIVLNLIGTEVAARTHPAGSPQLGTMAEFTSDLRDKATNAPVGSTYAVCIRARQPDMWVCHDAWDLQQVGPLTGGKKGTLMVGGLLDFNNPNFTAAIFGGTGDFRNAQGQIEGDSANYPPDTDYRVEILP
jgi:hypothetical protein